MDRVVTGAGGEAGAGEGEWTEGGKQRGWSRRENGQKEVSREAGAGGRMDRRR